MELNIPRLEKSFFQAGSCTFRLETAALTLSSSQLTYIVGHNGSGKSVFASLLSGEGNGKPGMPPVLYDERQEPAKVTVIRQRPEENVCLDLSVEENLVLRLSGSPTTRQLLRWPAPVSAEFDQGMLSRLASRRSIDASGLSAGERQILSFECARLGRADLYILDEFTSALDPAAKHAILPRVRDMHGAAVAIISHDVDEVRENADRILALCNGSIVFDGTRPGHGWDRTHIRELASGTAEPTSSL
jgi:ABC-type multidrug transport system ATPase subunit